MAENYEDNSSTSGPIKVQSDDMLDPKLVKPNNTYLEDNTMVDNSLNATEIAVGSLLAGGRGGGYGGYGGGGGGAWGGGYGGGGRDVWAGPGSNAVRLNRNNEVNRLGIDSLRDSVASNERGRDFDRLSDRLGNSELNSLREKADLARQISDCCCSTKATIAEAAKDAAKCCCEAQLQQCKDTADLKALIIKENGETRALITGSALDAANAKITQLETINALSGHHGRG